MASYLTPAEYRAAPTAISTQNLVPNGNQAQQDAELANVIARASGWVDGVVDQSLVAQQRTEYIRCRYGRDGWLSVHPAWSPLNQLVSAAIGSDPSNLTAITNLTGAFIDQQQWILPSAVGAAGGWPFTLGPASGGRMLLRLTTVSGWANTTLTADAAAAAGSITVADASGFLPAIGSIVADTSITIYDGEHTETITVAAVAGKVLTCTALAYAHTAGTAVSGLPADVKQAAILAVSALIRARGTDAMVVSPTAQPGTLLGGDPQSRTDQYNARQILVPQYSRVR